MRKHSFMTATLMLVIGALVSPARALEVFACEPEWASLVKELAGDRASVYAATTAQQDPHRIEARPSLIARVRRADLLVCSGADLEIGWLPLLLRQGANARIQPGQPGHFLAAAQVALIDRPAQLDRSLGDVHAAGNPHLHLDPRNIARVAEALAARLAQLDPTGAASYAARHDAFASRWQAALVQWQARAAPLKGVRVVIHHPDLNYLLGWLGMSVAGTLEPKPGIPPTAGHLAGLLESLRTAPAKAILRTPFEDAKPSAWLAGEAGIQALELPYTVGGAPGADDLFGLFEISLSRLLEAMQDASS